MSDASGEGAANDATAIIDEPEPTPEVLAQVALIFSAQQDRAHRRYDEQRQIKGTREHSAHVAQLRRIVGECEAAVTGAATAHRRAQDHEDGAAAAHAEAQQRLNEANTALAEAVSSDGVE